MLFGARQAGGHITRINPLSHDRHHWHIVNIKALISGLITLISGASVKKKKNILGGRAAGMYCMCLNQTFFFHCVSHSCLCTSNSELNMMRSIFKTVSYIISRVCTHSWENPHHTLTKLWSAAQAGLSLLFLTLTRGGERWRWEDVFVWSWRCGRSLVNTTHCGFAGYWPGLVTTMCVSVWG